jgi:UDP-N-acetyl-D-glucosamine dehydrogenase
MTSSFIKKTEDKTLTVGVIGLGYVGLPLVLNYAAKGYHVIGFDVDLTKIEALEAGQSYIKHIDSAPIAEYAADGRIKATNDFNRIGEVDAVIICVPTPLSAHREPDLSYIEATLDSIVPFLKPGQLVSLESTTYPGTTIEVVQPRIESGGLEVGESIFLVFSPEREDPGNENFAGPVIPKVLGGVTKGCLERGLALYGAIYAKVVPVSSPSVAEFTKLLENIYRAVNIGLVNEMKIVASAMGVDIWEVIDAAKTKPFGFTAFYPGPGLGGHCIPIDPFYLTWKAREYGLHTRFIELAGEINRSIPEYVVEHTAGALNTLKKPVNGSRVLLIGLAYKANVDDMRESPTFALMDLLKERGALISYHDPHIARIMPTRAHAEWTGLESVKWDQENISSYDCVIVVTRHDACDFNQLAQWAPCIVDTRNAMEGIQTAEGQVIKA